MQNSSYNFVKYLHPKIWLSLSLFVITFSLLPISAYASEVNFPYSGRLAAEDGKPLEGPVDLVIEFFSVNTGGDNLAEPLLIPGVQLQDGVFQIDLALDSKELHQILGSMKNPVWLQVTDSTNGSVYPRQMLAASPYAMKVPVDGSKIGWNSNGELTILDLPSQGQVKATSGLIEVNSSGTVTKISATEIGNKTSSEVSNAVTSVDSATPNATADSLVKRDGTGGIAASEIVSNSLTTDSIMLDQGNYLTTIQPSPSQTGNYALTLPVDDGANDQVLTTNGAGILSWTPKATGAGNMDTTTYDKDTDGAVDEANFIGSQSVVTTINEGAPFANGDLTLTVTSAVGFPARGILQIEDELLEFTAVVGNDLTVQRGQHGTTDATHADGTKVRVISFAEVVSGIPKVTIGDGALLLNQGGRLTFTDNDNTNEASIAAPADLTTDVTYTLPAAPVNGFLLSTDASGALSWIDPTEASTFDTTGTAGNVPLSVQGDAAQTANLSEWKRGATTTTVVDENGSIGIGSTNPTTKLAIESNSAATGASDGILVNQTGVGDAAISFKTPSEQYIVGVDQSDADKFKISDGADFGTDRLVIDSSGNVGIGTTSPAAKLDVRSEGVQALRLTRTESSNTPLVALGLRRFRTDAVAPGAGFGTSIGFTLEGFTDGSAGFGGTISSAWENTQTNDSTDRDSNMTFSVSRNDAIQDAMHITSDSYVGIGTTSPASFLHVQSGTPTITDPIAIQGIVLERNLGTGLNIITPNNASGNIYFGDPEDSDAGRIKYVHSSDHMRFDTAGAEKLRITSSGNVGIGTTQPAGILSVLATANYLTTPHFERSQATGPGSAATARFVASMTSDMADGFGSHIDFMIKDDSDVENILGGFGAVRSGADNTGAVVFRTSINGSQSEKVRITPEGNVGIGTKSPVSDTLLHIEKEADSARALLRSYSSDSTNGGILRLSHIRGNEGSPLRTLDNDLIGAISFEGYADQIRSGNAISILADGDWGDGALHDKPTRIEFSTVADGTSQQPIRMVIKGNGNVGIGTDDPSDRLHISGGNLTLDRGTASTDLSREINIGGARQYDTVGYFSAINFNNYDNDSGATDYIGASIQAWNESTNDGQIRFLTTKNTALNVAATINSDGNVGIGTSSPDKALHVKRDSGAAVTIEHNTESGFPALRLFRSKGDGASPTMVANASIVGQVNGKGWDGDRYIDTGFIRFTVNGVPGNDDMPGKLTFATTPDNTDVAQERMTILQNGNVGIGSTSPIAQLEIDSKIIENLSISTCTPASNEAVFDTTPDLSTVSVGDYFVDEAGDTFEITSVDDGTDTIGFLGDCTQNGDNDAFIFKAKGLIVKTGNVGIGTTDPQTTLDINGVTRLARYAAEPFVCDAAHSGALAMTSTFRLCTCNGTPGWVFTSDGSTSCTW